MLLGGTCTVCGDEIDRNERTVCDPCGRSVHVACRAYHETFDCRTLGTDLDVGAVEF